MRLRQLTLDLKPRDTFLPEDFLVSPCNRDAAGWVERWPDWPDRCLWLCGPPGAGKSHLAAIWAAKAGAASVPAASLTADAAGTQPTALALEDIDTAVDEIALFHLVNRVREKAGHLLLTAAVAPAALAWRLPDLRSRLKAMPVAAIDPPDDMLLAALLVKQFDDRQIAVDDAVIGYLMTRIERSFAAARAMVAALDRAALSERRAITVPLARAVLEEGLTGRESSC
jgi:DnaA regulatory inactivator Hda